ncbi:putative glutathione S-transferase [Polychytrium aggregatum]|uniref:putative glutathione S-transferase n=1 Tax=Polychytrium aggregatum TaxID=110093 RepID=UPI0022FDDC63|nr:putative glutathione S-transferase [Polychytrium aggregatum]KAI9207437.1 putative glutathione S-transferase [Polychytrium aggregatum]
MSSDSSAPKVWTPPSHIEDLYARTAGNKFASTNAPTAGARNDKEVPVGTAPFQLYSLGTPNGAKVGIILEELGIEYDAHFVSLGGSQFDKGFVQINPNSKIPAAVDLDGPDHQPINLFESASIMLYLAEKHGKFLPASPRLRTEVISWLFWQIGGQGPMTGNFGHFFVYAPEDQIEARNYGVARYGMETQRLCDVLDKHLKDREYIVGDEVTIADFAIFPWFNMLRIGSGYKHPSGVIGGEFLGVSRYHNLNRWAERIAARPGVQRGLQVCTGGVGKPWLEKPASL